MKPLHIDSSATGANSVTRELTVAIVARWQHAVPGLAVLYRDLDLQPVAHVSAQTLARTDPSEVADADNVARAVPGGRCRGGRRADVQLHHSLDAEGLLDLIAVAGKTFRYGGIGPEGLAGRNTVIIASGSGGLNAGASSDFQEPCLRHMFGFLGIDDVQIVRAEGVAFSPQHRVDALAAAREAIPQPLPVAA